MVCVLQSAGCKGNLVLQLALWVVCGQVALKSSRLKLCRLSEMLSHRTVCGS